MDIGIVHPELIYPRGAEKQVCKVAYYLNRMGHDVTIYMFEKKDNYVFDPLLKHVKLVSLDKKWFLNYLLGFNNLRWNQLIKEIASKLDGHDVINAQNHPAQWISAYTDIPTVWNCNEPYPYDSLISRLFYRKDQKLSSNVKLIVSHNLKMKGLIHDIYPETRIEMAGTGVDLNRPIKHQEDKYFDSIFVGPLHYKKRQIDIVKAFALLKDQIPNSRLHFVGGEIGFRSKSIKKTMLDIGRKNQIEMHFYETVSDEKLYQLYDLADISIFVPEKEPWGIFPLETILGGIPTIISDECGVKNILPEDQIVIETGNIGQLAHKILEVKDNMEYYRKQSRNTSKLIVEKYSWKSYTKRMENYFKKVI